MDVQKIQAILAVAGTVTLGLPMLLRAIEAFLLTIPGNQGETKVAKFREFSEKVAEIVYKFYPNKGTEKK